MADIELVIKISEEQYEMIQNISNFISADATQLIRDGKPLPKGHGKLIDADEEIQRFCGKVCGCTIEECGYGFYCPLVRRMISAPTIIEADKENKKDEHMTVNELAELFTGSEG